MRLLRFSLGVSWGGRVWRVGGVSCDDGVRCVFEGGRCDEDGFWKGMNVDEGVMKVVFDALLEVDGVMKMGIGREMNVDEG